MGIVYFVIQVLSYLPFQSTLFSAVSDILYLHSFSSSKYFVVINSAIFTSKNWIFAGISFHLVYFSILQIRVI